MAVFFKVTMEIKFNILHLDYSNLNLYQLHLKKYRKSTPL